MVHGVARQLIQGAPLDNKAQSLRGLSGRVADCHKRNCLSA